MLSKLTRVVHTPTDEWSVYSDSCSSTFAQCAGPDCFFIMLQGQSLNTGHRKLQRLRWVNHLDITWSCQLFKLQHLILTPPSNSWHMLHPVDLIRGSAHASNHACIMMLKQCLLNIVHDPFHMHLFGPAAAILQTNIIETQHVMCDH